ncbi:MAG: DNRLRE domain-containing protein [Candidatus Auribacterota bacterium]|nr:DNRLRE domain-containing protein [Candidatus Auribacterota bacterium]
MKRFLIFTACAVYSLSTAVMAFSYTLQLGSAETKDTTVLISNPDTNYGNDEYMFVSDLIENSQHFYAYSLLQFDVPAQLASVEIENVTLVLTVAYGLLTDLNATTAYRITSSWEEDQVTFNDMPSYDSANPVATAPVSIGMLWVQPLLFDITDAFIDWQQGLAPNYGLLFMHNISGQNDPTNFLQIFSSDAQVYQPQLLITFTQIPEPLSCVMLGIALVSMKFLRNRR